jgi:hypothetical protein
MSPVVEGIAVSREGKIRMSASPPIGWIRLDFEAGGSQARIIIQRTIHTAAFELVPALPSWRIRA